MTPGPVPPPADPDDAPDGGSTVARLRREKDELFRSDPRSPIEDRASFRGLAYYPEDPSWRREGRLEPVPPGGPEPATGERVELDSSTGERVSYVVAGRIRFDAPDGTPLALLAFSPVAVAEGGRGDGPLFAPFRDATSGRETYAAGRYLEPERLPGGGLLLDMNRAYHPYCAYSDRYRCPFPPASNRLEAAVRAGERLPDPDDGPDGTSDGGASGDGPEAS